MIALILVAVLAALISLAGDWCRARGYQNWARRSNAAIVGVYVGAFCGLVLGLVAAYHYDTLPNPRPSRIQMDWAWATELAPANGALLGLAIAILVTHLQRRPSDAR